MMSYLNEREIFDYLMSSDFNEGLNSDEFRFLLLKFRYNYRLLYTKNESMSYRIDNMKQELEELKLKMNRMNEEFNRIDSDLQNERSRRLTWKERILGKKNIK